MESPSENFRKNYKLGDILYVHWGRGNAGLRRICVYYGTNPYDDAPLLMDAQKFLRENQALFFDAQNDINAEKTTCAIKYSPFHDIKYADILKI